MFLEARAQLRIRGVVDHGGERLQDLVLGVINVLQTVQEKVLQRFDVLGEKAHCVLTPLARRESNDDGNSRFHRARAPRRTNAVRDDAKWSGTAGWARTTDLRFHRPA